MVVVKLPQCLKQQSRRAVVKPNKPKKPRARVQTQVRRNSPVVIVDINKKKIRPAQGTSGKTVTYTWNSTTQFRLAQNKKRQTLDYVLSLGADETTNKFQRVLREVVQRLVRAFKKNAATKWYILGRDVIARQFRNRSVGERWCCGPAQYKGTMTSTYWRYRIMSKIKINGKIVLVPTPPFLLELKAHCANATKICGIRRADLVNFAKNFDASCVGAEVLELGPKSGEFGYVSAETREDEQSDLDADSDTDDEQSDLDADSAADDEQSDLDADPDADVEQSDLDADPDTDDEQLDLDADPDADVEQLDLGADLATTRAIRLTQETFDFLLNTLPGFVDPPTFRALVVSMNAKERLMVEHWLTPMRALAELQRERAAKVAKLRIAANDARIVGVGTIEWEANEAGVAFVRDVSSCWWRRNMGPFRRKWWLTMDGALTTPRTTQIGNVGSRVAQLLGLCEGGRQFVRPVQDYAIYRHDRCHALSTGIDVDWGNSLLMVQVLSHDGGDLHVVAGSHDAAPGALFFWDGEGDDFRQGIDINVGHVNADQNHWHPIPLEPGKVVLLHPSTAFMLQRGSTFIVSTLVDEKAPNFLHLEARCGDRSNTGFVDYEYGD